MLKVRKKMAEMENAFDGLINSSDTRKESLNWLIEITEKDKREKRKKSRGKNTEYSI